VRRLVTTGVLLSLVLLAGCGGGSEVENSDTTDAPTTAEPTTSTEPKPDVDEYAAAFAVGLSDGAPEGVTDADIECATTGMVEAIGVDRLIELEITPDDVEDSTDFSEFDRQPERAEVRAMVDAMFECIDMGGAFASIIASELSSSVDSEMFATDDVVECFANAMSESDAIREMATDSWLGEEPADGALLDEFGRPLFACVDWSAVLAVGFQAMIGQELAPESIACLNETVDRDEFAGLVVDAVENGTDMSELGAQYVQRHGTELVACLTAEERGLVGAAIG
jgi:hypothetical protein